MPILKKTLYLPALIRPLSAMAEVLIVLGIG